MKHLRLLLCAFLILTMALSTCGAVAESTGGAVDPTTMTPEELVQYYQAARAAGTNDRLKQWYDPAIFDLSDLPEYNPDFEVSGTIRQWGSNYIEDSGLVQMWEAEFKSFHPDVVFEDTLTSSANAFPGLITGQADIGQMGREARYHELNGFQRQCALGYALEISTCFGSYEVRGWTFSLAIFVNSENPLESLTLQQVDGIFGAARSGGWKGLTWDPAVARGADENIRYWGQLGLTGEWENARIQPYGYTFSYNFPDEFEKKVFQGGQRWNEDMIEVSNGLNYETGRVINGGTYMIEKVKEDKFAICYTGAAFLTDGVKMLALAKDENSPAYENNYENIHNATYPLTRGIFAYANPLQAANPVVAEFLKYITSKQGQTLVAWDAKYVPMNAEYCQMQWDILEDARQKSDGYFAESEGVAQVNGAVLEHPAVDFIGTMMVPVAEVVNALGGTYTYDEETYAATIELNNIVATVKHGNVNYELAGEKRVLSQPCFIVNDLMYVPVEYVTNAFGVQAVVDGINVSFTLN